MSDELIMNEENNYVKEIPDKNILLFYKNHILFSLFCKQKIEVFEVGDKILQEASGGRTVERTVVEGEGKSHCGIYGSVCLEAVYGAAYAEDSGLRRIDNGCEAFNAH